jgi:hypothetical protein
MRLAISTYLKMINIRVRSRDYLDIRAEHIRDQFNSRKKSYNSGNIRSAPRMQHGEKDLTWN